jgi:uncharacterized protein YraI
MSSIVRYAAPISVLAALFASGPALAANGYSTAHLNLRTGPGTQYPVAGVMNYNVRSEITGCLVDWTWCSVNVAGLSGWAAAEYLVVDEGGQIMNVATAGAQTGIPNVAAEGIEELVAAPAVGEIVTAGGFVEAIVPDPAVVEFIAAAAVDPVFVNGEVVVGAALPAAVQLYEVPSSPYAFAIINGQRVLVDPGTRTIAYINR